MNLDILEKFCELKSVEKTLKCFNISKGQFFEELAQISNFLSKGHSNRDVIAFIDGASSKNPGLAGIGVVFVCEGKVIDSISKPIGIKTNNEAEYIALIEALQVATKKNIKSIKISSDSELIVNQINGKYKINQPHLLELNLKAKELIKQFQHFVLNHIPREQNSIADKLAKSAIGHNDIQVDR